MQLNSKYDVIVAGAGIAGISAAIKAGSLGSRVLLVEHYPFLGGMSSAGMVSPFMKSKSGDIELVKGLYKKYEQGLIQRGGMIDNGFYSWAFRSVANQFLADNGVDVAYNCDVMDAVTDGQKLTGIKTATPQGEKLLEANYFIDTTGDAQLIELGGFPWEKGDIKKGDLQALTLFFRMGGIDVKATADYSKQHQDEFLEWMDFEYDFSKIISIAGYTGLVEKAKKEGRFPETVNHVFFTTLPASGEGSFNTTNILGIDPSTSYNLTQAEREGHKQVAQIVDFLNRDVPGFEQAFLIDTAVQVGVRETRRAVAQYMVTGEDIANCAKFEDVVARGCYGVDIHGQRDEDNRLDEIEEGAWYEIPLRALRVKNSENLMVAGRCIGATREGHAALRVMPTSAASGEACGAATALAVQKNCPLDEVAYSDLKTHLRENIE